MASAKNRKRPRATLRTSRSNSKMAQERYLVDAQGKRVAVVLDFKEYNRLVTTSQKPVRISAARRARLVALARRAEGNWKDSEGRGTAVEIVRRLRDEWRSAS